MEPQKQRTLKAKYQANKNVFMTCYLDILEANAEGVRTTVGIRKPGDSILPLGTKLYLPSQASHVANGHVGEIETFFLQVTGNEDEANSKIQLCTPITKEVRPNLRGTERRDAHFNISVIEMAQSEFTVTQGSLAGLTVSYKASQLLMGVVVGKQYHLLATHKEQTSQPIPIQLTHIHYDWITLQHQMGLQILKLNAQQELILNYLLDPDFKIELKQKATVDAEEARIRPDL